MADLKNKATGADAKIILESALGGETVESLLKKAPFFAKGQVKGGLQEVIGAMVETINNDKEKTPDSIMAALKINPVITEKLSMLNQNKGMVGLEKDVIIGESTRQAVGNFLQANIAKAEPDKTQPETATAKPPATSTATPTTTPAKTEEAAAPKKNFFDGVDIKAFLAQGTKNGEASRERAKAEYAKYEASHPTGVQADLPKVAAAPAVSQGRGT